MLIRGSALINFFCLYYECLFKVINTVVKTLSVGAGLTRL